MNTLFGVFAFSLVIERAVEQIIDFIPKKKRKTVSWALCTFFGLLITFFGKVGLFTSLGFFNEIRSPGLNYVDYFLTGLLIGGGSEPVHSVINGLARKKEEIKMRTKNYEKISK